MSQTFLLTNQNRGGFLKMLKVDISRWSLALNVINFFLSILSVILAEPYTDLGELTTRDKNMKVRNFRETCQICWLRQCVRTAITSRWWRRYAARYLYDPLRDTLLKLMLIAILSYSDAWYFERVIRANFTARKRERMTRAPRENTRFNFQLITEMHQH